MKTSTHKQISLIRMLLANLGITDMKANLALQYSNGRTEHTSELTQPEVTALINFLKKDAQLPETPAAKMRRKILSMAHEMRWELEGGRINMDRVNSWCIKYGHCHKSLDQCNESELPQLVTQFESVYNSYLAGV